MLPIHDLADQTHTLATRLGIRKYDIYGGTVDETNVQVDHGEPKQIKASQRSSVTVRVWNDQEGMGVTSTTDVEAAGLEVALQTAYEASFWGAKTHVPDFSPEATLPLPALDQERAPAAPASELLTRLTEAERELMSAHPAIQGVPYNGLSQRDIERFYLNSEGSRRQEGYALTSLYLYSRTEEAGKKPRSAGAYRVSRRLDSLDVAGCIQEAADKTISHLDYDRIPTGRYTVVFSPEAFLSVLGAFSNLYNAQNILDRQSLSTPDSLGTQIASPLLSVFDDALHPQRIPLEGFDGEGTPTRRTPIISNGVLTQFLHSAGTAKRMGCQPTGHANLGSKVTVGAHYFHVLAGDPAPRSYRVEESESVVWIDEVKALHAGVKALQGSFSLPFDGWWIRNGERTSIESATVAGDFLTLLQSILYVEPDPEVTPGGICPRIWIQELAITGD